MEMLPTLLSEARVRLSRGLVLDGYDMMLVLATGIHSPRSEMFWQRRNDKATRVGDWKWVESEQGNGLFNLDWDHRATRPRARGSPTGSHRLKRRNHNRIFGRKQQIIQNPISTAKTNLVQCRIQISGRNFPGSSRFKPRRPTRSPLAIMLDVQNDKFWAGHALRTSRIYVV